MGCGRDVRVDMLSLATFCHAIVDRLVTFWDEGLSHADLWIRVRGAIDFLDYYPERKPEKRKKNPFDDLPKYGFRGEIHRLSYKQLVVTQNFLKEHEKQLLETKKKLPMILDLQLSQKERRAAAGYCFKLFSDFMIRCLYYFKFPPTIGVPRGIRELLEEKDKKPKRVTRRKTTGRSEGKK